MQRHSAASNSASINLPPAFNWGICMTTVGCDASQAALDGTAPKKGKPVVAYAVALAAALSIESPFMHVDNLAVCLLLFLVWFRTLPTSLHSQMPAAASVWLSVCVTAAPADHARCIQLDCCSAHADHAESAVVECCLCSCMATLWYNAPCVCHLLCCATACPTAAHEALSNSTLSRAEQLHS